MTLAATALLSIPQVLIRSSTCTPTISNLQTVAVGVRLLAVAAIFQVFDGIQGVGTGAMRGLGKTRGPMLVNLVAYGGIGSPIGKGGGSGPVRPR